MLKASSYTAYYFCKLGGLAFAALAVLLVHGLLLPQRSFIDGIETMNTVWDTVSVLALSGLALVLSYFMFFRFRVIEYDNTNVRIIHGSERQRTTWSNIRSVTKVIGCTPPVYRMTFKDHRTPIYFIMSMFVFISIGVWSWDFTGFYEYARDKIDGNDT
jgi:hypothetical protein